MMWQKINQKLDCLFEWRDQFKIPNRQLLEKTRDILIFLEKAEYPAPSALTSGEFGTLNLFWEYDLVYIILLIKERGENVKIYFDSKLILEKDLNVTGRH